MVGGALVRRFQSEPGVELLLRTRKELDLTSQAAVEAFYAAAKPDVVIVAAAKVGGIHANNTYPADFLYDNLVIASNTIHGAFRAGVKRLLFLGSSCIYPKLAPQPMPENCLLTGPARAHQRGLRHREDRGSEAVRVLPQAARRALSLGDADQPLRPGRQLPFAEFARAAGAHPQVS